jgi:ankyrin repeat protein
MSLVNEQFEAIAAGREERVRELVADRPTLAATTDDRGVSAILNACSRHNDGIVQALVAAAPGLDLFEAAAVGDPGLVAQRISADPAQVSAYAPDGFTALHHAALFGHTEVVRLLLERGAAADTRSRNAANLTPLHGAAASGDAATASLLLVHRADVDARRQGGWTALQIAAGRGDRRLIDLLLRAGADPSLVNDSGDTPAKLARNAGHPKAAQMIETWAAGRVSEPRPDTPELEDVGGTAGPAAA